MKEKNGVIVGSNARQEWLLPWWWENFRKYNDCPVTFIDFGLSQEKKIWCKERGTLITLQMTNLFVKDRDEIDPHLMTSWEQHFPDTFWESRKEWFKKPFACLLSPYERTIWIDLDCEVLQSIQGLFDACEHPSKLALVKDPVSLSSSFPIYNSGVIAFQKNHPVLIEWAKQSLLKNGLFRGDQDLLSQIIADQSIEIYKLPSIYNWSIGQGENKEAIIYHWLGDFAKRLLQNKLTLDQLS